MARYKMHDVSDTGRMINPGDYVLVTRSSVDPDRVAKGRKYPIIVCPKCLHRRACSAHTLVQENPLTIRASFLCGPPLSEPCGWHGWVTDGFMDGD